MDFGVTGVAGITVICYLVGLTVKASRVPDKWIPVITGVTGGALGIPALRLMAEFPAQEPLTAVAVGIVSGLAATGVHQMYRQLKGEDHGK